MCKTCFLWVLKEPLGERRRLCWEVSVSDCLHTKRLARLPSPLMAPNCCAPQSPTPVTLRHPRGPSPLPSGMQGQLSRRLREMTFPAAFLFPLSSSTFPPR